jgi:mRNA interferase YafQ
MLRIITTKKFHRDVKKAEKQEKKLILLKKIMTDLANEIALPLKFRDHKLTGNYINHRECHVAPDWLLIYKLEKNDIIFERTGSHSELFT